ncbi:hypothetical protein EW145_g2410 [Phellinidium pouzarii]|uniref:Nicotinamide-nucleotide adenylyltransferase n=1 Tax=Phellinidium pouzarii TaxID=167371 RepID=A0A4S4LCW9_9AGAM|nr:hypothetical protein EW145_g2410 [Phellinidium pouzarii]
MVSANNFGSERNAAGKRDSELPSYADSPRTTRAADTVLITPPSNSISTQHDYWLDNTKGKHWLSLRVFSRAPTSKTLPVFYNCDEVRGEVMMELEKPEGYKGVVVGISAENTIVGQESEAFVDLSTTLWSPTPSSPKLSGSLVWPFSLTLPKEAMVSISSKDPPKSYPLPPTFSERASPAYIDYKITITVKRGMFKVNQTFAYVPRWIAPPPSSLRRLAYSDGSPLIGPEGDPEGWKNLPPVKVAGTLFDAKTVQFEATLVLGSPLSYATGSPIPLLLTLTSADAQVLDLLSQPSAISVFLTRTIAIGSTATDETAPRRSNNTFLEHINRAFWWPSEEGAPQEDTRVLHGEIDVKKGMRPGFVFPRLSIRYYLSMLPFSASGFVQTETAAPNSPLLSEKISIVTENAPGVIPRSHAPPGFSLPWGASHSHTFKLISTLPLWPRIFKMASRSVLRHRSTVELVYQSHARWPLAPSQSVTSTLTDSSKAGLRISILDSSFNPPTLAHLALARSTPAREEGLDYDARLLLLSVRNADKALKPGDASYAQRLEMMILLANELEKEAGPSTDSKSDNVAVAIIDEPTFVRNSSETETSIHTPVKLTFIMGFDTLERLLAPRYYGDSLDEMYMALKRFFAPDPDGDGSAVVCAWRRGSRPEYSPPAVGYLPAADAPEFNKRENMLVSETQKKLQETLLLAQPFVEAGSVSFTELTEQEMTLSSSEIRTERAKGSVKWLLMVPARVGEYIVQEEIYVQ